jgi:hypothetical protein
MTLTTETIQQWRRDAESIARGSCEYETEYSAAEAILALTAELLAYREAQPIYQIWDDGRWYDADEHIWRETYDEFCESQFRVVYTAPPVPAYPERLPCPVHLLPGLKLGKGVPTSTLLAALVRRAEYNAEMEAMTPEERAEHDARAKLFKAMLPHPAPEI